jgi:Tol biopolymer transport system component
VSVPDGVRLGRFVLSPDGRSLAFTASSSGGLFGLWVHSFATGQSRHLARAGEVTAPIFWSPDSSAIAFVANSTLQRIGVDGTPPQPIARIDGFVGAQWTSDGTILYGRARGGLMKVAASGGVPVAVTELDAARDETGHIYPQMLPDGRHFLYVRASRTQERDDLFVGSLDAAPAAQATRSALPIRTVPLLSRSPAGGVDLLFVRDGTLMAQALDATSMTLSGAAFAVAEGVGQVSVEGDTLAFRAPGTPQGGVPTWFARSGHRLGGVFATPIPPILFPQLSPDGKRLVATVGPSLWVYSLDGRPAVRLTVGDSLSPRWTPDGQSIVYERFGAVAGLAVISADGSSSVPRAVGPPGHFHAHGFVDGGVLAAFGPPGSGASWQIVRVPLSGTDAPVRVGDIAMPDGAAAAALSPDGRWLAYITNTTGSAELWVRRYPALDTAVRVSPNGAAEPVWAKDGRELFYLEGDKLMSVRAGADTQARFTYQPPVMIAEKSFIRSPQPPSFDVAADGRLLMLERGPAVPVAPVEVIVNWRHRTRPRRRKPRCSRRRSAAS